MAVARFPFFHGLPTVLVAFHPPNRHGAVSKRLLVDSGFTGGSAFVLSIDDAEQLRRRAAPTSEVSGALLGAHQRVWIKYSLADFEVTQTAMAIASDLSSLALPEGIDGLAGLTFLSQFHRWGGELVAPQEWNFTLETD